MRNSIYETYLRVIILAVFMNTNIQFKMMNTTTMIAYMLESRRELAITDKNEWSSEIVKSE